jgi:hypothetical protein
MAKSGSTAESIITDGFKITRKWVKRANMWMKKVEELGSKDMKGKVKMKITWHDDRPELTNG